MQTKYIGVIIAIVVSLLMYGITRLDAFEKASNNMLMIVFMIIVMGVIGHVVAELLGKIGKKGGKREEDFTHSG